MTLTTTPNPGYHFDRWESDDVTFNVTITDISFTMPEKDVTVKAIFEADAPTTYTVTFDAGDGIVTPASGTTGTDGKLASLPMPTRSGYLFFGWFDAATGGNRVTTDTVFTTDSTIYARWAGGGVPQGGCSLTLNENWEDGTVRTIPNVSFYVLPTIIRPGYVFDGWSTDPAGSVEYRENDTITLTADTTLYALWSKSNASTLILNENWEDGTVRTIPNVSSYVLPTVTRFGETFYGWANVPNGMARYCAGDTVTLTHDLTLYAVWRGFIDDIHYVIFDANGGTGTMVPGSFSTQYPYTGYTIPDCGFTREGYTFKGWATSPTGAVAYLPGNSYKSTDDLFLFAVWEQSLPIGGLPGVPDNGYSLELDENWANGSVDLITNIFSYVLPAPGSRPGYVFLGWSKDPNGTAEYSAGQNITLTKDTTLYALWEDLYTLTLNENWDGGTTTQIPDVSSYKLSSPVSRTGYSFLGWSTEQTGTAEYSSGDTVPLTADTTLYALWIPTVTVTVEGNGTASASKTVCAPGTEVTLTFSPEDGYHFREWQAVSPTGLTITGNKFIMPDEPVTVKAVFGTEEPAPHVHNDMTFSAWESATSLPGPGNWYLTQDLVLDAGWGNEAWNVQGSTYLCLNGYSITATNYNDCAINIGKGVLLGLYDCSASQGRILGTKAYCVNNRGALFVIGGVISNSNGGGVFNGGEFTMNGGMLTDGVYNIIDAVFTMNGGTISGGTADFTGGGVCNTGTFTMNGGVISANSSDSGGGVWNSGTFTMNGGVISGNTADLGDGVYLLDGDMFIGGTAQIVGNSVYIPRGKTRVLGDPKEGMSVSIAMEEPGVFTSATADGYIDYFTSADSRYVVMYDENAKLLLAAAYAVNIADTQNGTVTPGRTPECAGETVSLTVTPDDGYRLKSLQYNDGTDHDIPETDGAYSFVMPEKEVTVTAVFEPIGYDLWVSGVQVTEVNKGNVLNDSGTPTVTYDPAIRTLTLNDYDGSYIKANCPLNIVLADGTTNAISVPSNTDENGIYANGGCTISGSGSLTVEVYNLQGDAIRTIGDLTISGAVDLRVDRSYHCGIFTEGDVSVSGNCSLTFLTGSSSIAVFGDLSISGSVVADIHSSWKCITCYSVSVDLSDSGSMTLKSEIGGDGINAQNDVVIGGSGEVTINADGRGICSNSGSVIFSGNGVITVTSVSDAVAINDPTGEKALLLNGTAAPITLIAGDSHMAVAGYRNKTSPVGGASLLTYYDDITGAPNESKVIYDHVPSYGVSFEMNGHGDQITAQTVREGDKATKPADPTASGWTFGGWYADETFSVKFDFNTAITANTTIYAKWTENTTPPAPTYTMIAGMGGEWTEGSMSGLSFTSDAPFAKFDSVQVDGSTIAAENYTAEEGSTKITLAPAYLETLSIGSHSIKIVSKDGSASTTFTVKAAAKPPVPAKHTVSFNMNGHGTQVKAQAVEDGGKAVRPADPKASGYTFGGWYADATFSTKFDFNTAITANTTVYAKWTKNSVTPADPTSPQTGDTSNMFLWIALLLVSGGALVGTTVYGRKKKYNAK